MKVTAIKTHKITKEDTDICAILEKYLPPLKEKSIVAIASSVVAVTQGRIVKIGTVDKDRLIEEESQYYLPRWENKYNVSFTITNNTLVATAGIDESNGNGHYVLWPKNPQAVTNNIRQYIRERRGIRKIGVIITDSKTTPLRWGVTGTTIGYSGIVALRDYIGKPDVFGNKLEYTKLNVIDALASAAVLIMGEGNEQTPIAVISDLKEQVVFQDHNPTEEELQGLKISIEDDLYAPFLKSARWRKGKA